MHRLDDWRVGLSYQFFNKTRRNVLENPMVQVLVVSPETADQYRLDLRYERTEVEGPVLDRMSTRLAAVASQTGMSQVFTLRGVDVSHVFQRGQRQRRHYALTQRFCGSRFLRMSSKNSPCARIDFDDEGGNSYRSSAYRLPGRGVF